MPTARCPARRRPAARSRSRARAGSGCTGEAPSCSPDARKSCRSLPAVKDAPSPENTTARTSQSSSACARASAIATYISRVSALRFFGRLSRISSTCAVWLRATWAVMGGSLRMGGEGSGGRGSSPAGREAGAPGMTSSRPMFRPSAMRPMPRPRSIPPTSAPDTADPMPSIRMSPRLGSRRMGLSYGGRIGLTSSGVARNPPRTAGNADGPSGPAPATNACLSRRRGLPVQQTPTHAQAGRLR